MASTIEKRLSLHRELANRQKQNNALKAEIEGLQAVASIGTASYMIAHEINNLLTPLRSYAALALKNSGDKSLVEKALRKTVQNCERATKVVESMLALAQDRTQQKQEARLASLVEDVFTCLCRDFAKDGITVQTEIPENLTIWAVPVQIQQVLMNLILNARDAMLPGGGVLTIKAAESTDSVCIEVRDTGTGVDPANLENIFESFFTTKADENSPSGYSGSGLGLAFCKKIVDAHDGCISVESKPREGSIFKITLPLGK